MDCNEAGQPVRFTWHGRVYRLSHVVQRWEVHTDWWDPAGEVNRSHFAVLTFEGLFCVLIQDHMAGGEWRLLRIYD